MRVIYTTVSLFKEQRIKGFSKTIIQIFSYKVYYGSHFKLKYPIIRLVEDICRV